MKTLLFVTLSAALLCTLVLSDRGGSHDCDHDHDHDHDHGPDHDHDHDHRHNHSHPKHHHHDNESMACHKIAQSNALFAFKIFKEIASKNPSDNILVSPVSISIAFALLSKGAKGETLGQILEGLGFNTSQITEEEIHAGFHHLLHVLNEPSNELQLNSGNALFISQNYKLLQTFLDDAKNLYESEAFTTDFQNTEEAKKQINSYVEQKTNGKIVDLLSSVDKDAALVILNYIYFRGKWENPFEEDFTKEDDFHVDENTVVKVPMMQGQACIMRCLKKTTPWWRFHTKAMPLHCLFCQNKDISERSKRVLRNSTEEMEEIFLATAVHKAVINVDEKGTEAAATTAFEIMPMSLPPKISFNRPFLLALYHRITHSIVFMGRIRNPVKK